MTWFTFMYFFCVSGEAGLVPQFHREHEGQLAGVRSLLPSCGFQEGTQLGDLSLMSHRTSPKARAAFCIFYALEIRLTCRVALAGLS